MEELTASAFDKGVFNRCQQTPDDTEGRRRDHDKKFLPLSRAIGIHRGGKCPGMVSCWASNATPEG